MGAADRMSRSFRWPSACRGTVLLPLDMQAMLAPGDEQAARHDQRRADPRRLGGEGGEEEPAAGDRPEQRRLVHWDDHRDRRQTTPPGHALLPHRTPPSPRTERPPL